MVLSPRPPRWLASRHDVPQRRRVIVIGATEAGLSAAHYLGEHCMLVERRFGRCVTAIHVHDRRLEVSGESFVFDKLVSTLSLQALQRLVAEPAPSRLSSDESWHHWLNARDIELLARGEAAGKHMAETIRGAMALKFATTPLLKGLSPANFRPRIVQSRGTPYSS